MRPETQLDRDAAASLYAWLNHAGINEPEIHDVDRISGSKIVFS